MAQYKMEIFNVSDDIKFYEQEIDNLKEEKEYLEETIKDRENVLQNLLEYKNYLYACEWSKVFGDQYGDETHKKIYEEKMNKLKETNDEPRKRN